MKAFFISLILIVSVTAQDIEDLMSMSLEDILNMEVTVASKKALTPRESPGIITVITSDEIQNSGARDLIDVLRLVPGVTFGVDVQGAVGIAIRGNWAHEGKVLMLLDGQEMNELSFSTTQFGSHIPVSNIKRIEMIRGPGSSIYGGFAELGVINIITKNGKDLNGFQVHGFVGNTSGAMSHGNGTVSFGVNDDDYQFAAHLSLGSAIRSEKDFSDFYEDTYNMETSSDLNQMLLNVGGTVNDFSFRLIYDGYEINTRDIFFVNADKAYPMGFGGIYTELSYNMTVNDEFTLTPKISYKSQKPWNTKSKESIALVESDDESYGGFVYDVEVTRLTANVIGSYDVDEEINIVGGVEYQMDEATDSYETSFKGGAAKSVDYTNFSVFGQGLAKLDFANITLGARYDNHSEFGSSFVPRAGFTKLIDNFHAKLLLTKAFRAPGFHNIADFEDRSGSGKKIKPESTTVYELEIGYKLTENMFVTGNIFRITVDDPIVYYYDDADKYSNYETLTNQGMELEFKIKDSWGLFTTSYSYYVSSENKVDQYEIRDVEGNIVTKDLLAGFPAHKVTFGLNVKFMDNLFLNSTLVYETEKYGYHAVDEEDTLIHNKFDPTALFGLNVTFTDILLDGLSAKVGVHNLLDEEYKFVQPYYDGYHGPYPDLGREFYVSFSFMLK